MKKSKARERRKLALKAETIQILAHEQLMAVAGGLPTTNTTSTACTPSLDSACTC